MNRIDAKKEFWEKTFKETFPTMDDYNKVLKMSYYGSAIDNFINKIYDDIEYKICENCKFFYIPEVEHLKNNTECDLGVVSIHSIEGKLVSPNFGCNKWIKKN